MDDGLSLAIAQENEGVSKVIAAGNYLWTATSRSSINRWASVDTGADVQLPEAFQRQRAASSATSRPRQSSLASTTSVVKKEIPAKSILRISNTAVFPSQIAREPDTAAPSSVSMTRKGSEIIAEAASHHPEPIHQLPEETIEGQFGLVKHKLLNDRRRVLTLDTAGDVLLWDLIKVNQKTAPHPSSQQGLGLPCPPLLTFAGFKCEPIRKYGKRHLEDVEPEVNTTEAVAPWCSIDTSSGSLTVVLEPYNCFDAEMYADELTLEEPVDFREDQRSENIPIITPSFCRQLAARAEC
jgi:WD repeat-containing protein 48